MAKRYLDAILPAGGTLKTEAGSTVFKASLPLRAGTEHETTVLGGIIEALRDSGIIRKIVLIGPKEVTEGQDADFVLEPGETGPDNIYKGLFKLMDAAKEAKEEVPKNVLVATTDLPFLKAQSVRSFLAQVDPSYDLNMPIIRKESFIQTYPGAHATFAKIKEGSFTLGGLFHLNTEAMLKTKPHMDAVFAARKDKLRMARLFGPMILIKFVTGRLGLKEIEATAQRILQCSARAVTAAPVELAYDIDDIAEYHYALERLAEEVVPAVH